MMEAEVAEMGCPDLETLAAFVDGRLAAQERRSVMAHLAGCEACYEIVTETLHTEEELKEEAEPAPVVPLRPARRRFRWLGAAAAAALLAALIPVLFRSDLPRIPGSLPEEWSTPTEAYRGPGGSEAPEEWADLRFGALLADLELARKAGDGAVAAARAEALSIALQGEKALDTWAATVQQLGQKLEGNGLTPDTREQIGTLAQDMQAEFSPALQVGRWAQLGRFAVLADHASYWKGRSWRRQLERFQDADLPEAMHEHLRSVGLALEEGTSRDVEGALTALLTSDGGDL